MLVYLAPYTVTLTPASQYHVCDAFVHPNYVLRAYIVHEPGAFSKECHRRGVTAETLLAEAQPLPASSDTVPTPSEQLLPLPQPLPDSPTAELERREAEVVEVLQTAEKAYTTAIAQPTVQANQAQRKWAKPRPNYRL